MTITEVSKKYNLSPDTLRYYEKVGLIPPVKRTAGGIRNYTDFDCNWIEFIMCMRNVALPIEALANYVNLFMEGDDTAEQRKNILIVQREHIRQKIEELKNVEEHLSYKISHYDSDIFPAEKELRNHILKEKEK